MNCVVDCSFCAALFLPHEKSAAVKDLFRKIGDGEVYVPVQFWEEMAELVLAALKRGRLKHADVMEINRLLTMYHFSTVSSFADEYTVRLLDLAGLYGLSAVEAAYLELAVSRNVKLGTLNNKLNTACHKAGIETLL